MARRKPRAKPVVTSDAFRHEEAYYEKLRPKSLVDTRLNWLIAFVIFAISLIVYWTTQNRSVTFWDVGEYILCSSILGIPHPPGNPFYIFLARFFCILGLGAPHALVVNSISGLMAALAVMFTYLFTVKLVSMFEENKVLIITAAIIAALYNAFSYSFWNNAIEASVYPGRDLVINLIIYLTLVWIEKSRGFSHQNILLLIIYIFFIGFSIHQTALQIVPAVLLIVLYPMLIDNIKKSSFWVRTIIYLVIGLVLYFSFIEVGERYRIPDLAKIITAIYFCFITYYHLKEEVEGKAWLLGIAMIAIAFSPHLYLLVRSSLRPFINEGHPYNLELFLDYVLRRQYGVISFMERRAKTLYQYNYHFLRYFYWQFFHVKTIASWTKLSAGVVSVLSKFVVLFLGLFGIVHQVRRNKHSFLYLFSFFFMSCFAMVFVMNLSDAEVRDRDYFFVSAYYLWGVWMAIGSIGLINLVLSRIKPSPTVVGREKKPHFVTWLLIIVFLTLPIINFSSQLFIHNRSKEFIALDYGINFLNSLEENAIVFTNGDNDTFPLWYAQSVYDPNAYEHVYPAREIYPDNLAKEIVEKAVKHKRSQIKGIRPDVTVANLSLLNTPWYIRHLRDIEGVIFDMPDDHIDLIRPQRSERTLSINISSPDREESFRVTIPARKAMLIKDISAIKIIQNNFGRRPIYMAVTVADEIIFHDHLRNEGMVNRIVATRGKDQVDIERLKNNVDNVYSYRSIFDDNVHKDDNMEKLVMNYGAAFMRVSQYYNSEGDYSNSAKYLAKAVSYIKDKTRYHPAVVQQFREGGNNEGALEYINNVLDKEPHHVIMYLEAVSINILDDEVDEVFKVFERAANNRVVSSEILQYVFSASNRFHEYDRGVKIFQDFQRYDKNPLINEYIAKLNSLKRAAGSS